MLMDGKNPLISQIVQGSFAIGFNETKMDIIQIKMFPMKNKNGKHFKMLLGFMNNIRLSKNSRISSG